MDSGFSSDSSLGLPWASSTGSHMAFCKEEFPVSSYSFKVTSHNFVCSGFLRERLPPPLLPLCLLSWGPRISTCFFVPGPSFIRRKGHHNPIHFPLVPYSLVEGADTYIPSSGITPTSICARGEAGVVVRHNAIHPQKRQLISSGIPRAWETAFLPSPWDLALQI